MIDLGTSLGLDGWIDEFRLTIRFYIPAHKHAYIPLDTHIILLKNPHKLCLRVLSLCDTMSFRGKSVWALLASWQHFPRSHIFQPQPCPHSFSRNLALNLSSVLLGFLLPTPAHVFQVFLEAQGLGQLSLSLWSPVELTSLVSSGAVICLVHVLHREPVTLDLFSPELCTAEWGLSSVAGVEVELWVVAGRYLLPTDLRL